MEKIILIKYGELTTKKDNRKEFINRLAKNLEYKLKDVQCKIIKDFSRMYIYFDSYDEDKVCDVVKNTFGIFSYNFVDKVQTNIEDIKNKVLDILSRTDFKTFKVVSKRRDKSFLISSMDFNNLVGGFVLKNLKDKKVDVHNPNIYVNIEINKEDTYIYLNDLAGLKGYPVGIEGKGLVMLSGGIDSPVASFLALKRGIKIEAIYFEAIPHTSLNAREKVISLAKKLLKYTDNIKLYVVPITSLQEEIYKKCDSNYIITILRRMMYRIASLVAKENDDLILINGESIGQVASQTLNSIVAIESVCNMPVIRPVCCMDKLEIIDLAKKIDTYDISILPYEDCCTVFVPKHPVINPKEDRCIKIEERIDYNKFIEDIMKEIFVIDINDKKDFDDLL